MPTNLQQSKLGISKKTSDILHIVEPENESLLTRNTPIIRRLHEWPITNGQFVGVFHSQTRLFPSPKEFFQLPTCDYLASHTVTWVTLTQPSPALPGTASQLCTKATTKFSNFVSATLGRAPSMHRFSHGRSFDKAPIMDAGHQQRSRHIYPFYHFHFV